MRRGDLWAALSIGAAVGILFQPILANLAGQFGTAPTWALRTEAFFGFTILAPLALYALFLASRWVPVLYQFGKFAAVGTLNSFIDVGVLNLEILMFGAPGAGIYPVMKTISLLAATTNSYFWNRRWTFGAHDQASVRQAGAFYAVAAVGFLLNVGVASYVFSVIARPGGIAPAVWANVGALAGVLAAFLWDFLAYKYWVFRKPAPSVQ